MILHPNHASVVITHVHEYSVPIAHAAIELHGNAARSPNPARLVVDNENVLGQHFVERR